MKNKKLIYKATLWVVTLSIITLSCKEDKVTEAPIDSDLQIQNFVWKSMNSWYNWQELVPNLADSKDDNQEDYQSYLSGYTPSQLFESLKYNTLDRDSWFIEDYEEQEKRFQGISKSFGFKLGAVAIDDEGEIILYVIYVAPNSPADGGGFKRGDLIKKINGINLNESLFNTAVSQLNESETITFTVVDFNEANELVELEERTITEQEIVEDPVYYYNVYNVNESKVGYLVYNGFRTSYNDELNLAFSYFKENDIDELVLDLRINGGGSVQTSAYLASMIYGDASSNEIFAILKFNDKHAAENSNYKFQDQLNIYDATSIKTGTEPINRLTSLSRLYVLASGRTASASEMIINGLRSYMEVIIIGESTYGKNVGSITLYDSPSSLYTSKSSVNLTHKNALQPIVFEITNKELRSDYGLDGFPPNFKVEEREHWADLADFGDEGEPLLGAALSHIKGELTALYPISKRNIKNIKKIKFEGFDKQYDKEMYINFEDFSFKKVK